jgi:hypothetical protein
MFLPNKISPSSKKKADTSHLILAPPRSLMAYSTANWIEMAIKYLSFSDNSEEDVCQLLAYPEFTKRVI